MNASLRLIRVTPWLVAVTALGGAGCHKTAACRPGTLLVTLTCDDRTPAGDKTVLLTLKEGTFAAPVEYIPLTCPETNHQVTIGGYAAGRTLKASVALAVGDEPARTVGAEQTVNLQEGCTVLPVKVSGPVSGDGGVDVDVAGDMTADSPASPDVAIDVAGDGDADDDDVTADLTGDDADAGGTTPIDVGIDIVVTPVPDGGLFTNGATCVADGECASSKCAGGVCCEERCDGKCQVCTAGTGKCSNLPEGATSARCAAQPNAATCGETGACDAKGGCALFSVTTMCAPARCDGSGLARIAAAFCDGLGHCLAGQSADCGAYRCAGGACGQTCTVGDDCNGVACVDGHCGGKRGVGAACDNNGQCDKGFCVDGVCCESDCSGGCMACAESLTARPSGSCAPVTAGTDPRGKCDPEAATCGNDGTCDGRGACRKRGAETTCQAASCDGNHTFTKAAACNSKGACDVPVTTDCGLYRCTAGGCREKPCGGDGDCATGSAFCEPTSQQCQAKKALGGVCVHDEDCDGGPCVKGICCESACTGTCLSCSAADTGGAMGRCLPVVLGKADPGGGCAAEPESSCGKTGVCDGKGACGVQPATVECVAESCSASTYTPPSKCDGAGKCVTPGTKDCGAYLCAAGVRCSTSCKNDDDCSARSFCGDGRCTRAACTVDDWCIHNPRPLVGIADLWGPAENDIWAVSGGLIAHFDGVTWEGMSSITNNSLASVHGAGGVVWAVGEAGTILKWDGQAWRRTSSGVTDVLNCVWANTATDAWAVGVDVALHWDGNAWSKTTFAGSGRAITGSAPNDVWVAGDTVMYHWNGSNWAGEDLVGSIGDQASIRSLVSDPNGEVWGVVRDGDKDLYYIIHRKEGVWSTQKSDYDYVKIGRTPSGRLWFSNEEGRTSTMAPNQGETEPSPVAGLADVSTYFIRPISDTDVYLTVPLSGGDRVKRWNGTTLTDVFSGPTDPFVTVLGTSFGAMAAGPSGQVWSTSGAGWSPSATMPKVHDLRSIGSATVQFGTNYFAGGVGPVIAKYGYPVWTDILDGMGTDYITAIASSTTATSQDQKTWAVGNLGKIWTVPATGAPAPVVSGTAVTLRGVITVDSDVWAVGDAGTIVHKTGATAFAPSSSGTTQQLNGICANNARDIWAVGNEGALHGDGTTWLPMNNGLVGGLRGVVCLGTDVWASSVTDPVVWHYSGGQWSKTQAGYIPLGISANAKTIWISSSAGAILQRPR